MLLSSMAAVAQKLSYNARAQQYILQYKAFAQAEQQRSGVPAAIILAQGILETEAGNSELATLANNHFGIKCKKEWTGETFAHDDDAPQECFRKYASALQSYKDHSDYLKCGKRYQSCFAQAPTDYAAWAKELRKCGYATNPKYAQMLVKIIEDFHLQDYTYAAMNAQPEPVLLASASSPVATVVMAEKGTAGEVVPEHDTPASEDKPVYGQLLHRNGIKGFYARKGDVLLEYAIQYKVRYAKLLEINNLPDAPLAADMFVAVEKGGKVAQIIAHDVSAAPSQVVYTYIAPAKELVHTDIPVPTTLTAAAPSPDAAATVAITAPVAPAVAVTEPPARPVNIADEAAVEEVAPAVKEEDVPQDAFSRMKARLDKVVYAPVATEKKTTTVPATQRPVVPVVVASTASGKTYHTVRSGETAFGIARQYGISMKELMALNGLNFEAIKVGQKLRIK